MKTEIVLSAINVKYDYILTRYYYKLPSLGIGYIASMLKKNGYKVSIIDRTILQEEIECLADEIVKKGPSVAGFYCISETYKVNIRIIKKIKEKDPSIIIIIGGPHVYGIHGQGIIPDCVDYAFCGEAEEAFLKLLDCGFNPREFINIPGLIYRNGSQIKANPIALIYNLDKLSLPARDLYPPLRLYRPSILAYKRLPATGIITSRGCAYKCIFCHSGKGHFKLRFHSADYVIDEIQQLKKDFGINELVFFDDTFLINQDRAYSICEGIIKKNIDVSWSCNTRVNNINKDILSILKKAGCWLIQLGVESGNQNILDTIKKGITLEGVEKACRLIYKTGIDVKTYFILGHPGETVNTLNDTIRFMTRLPARYAAINFMTPFPGTQLWDTAEKFGYFDRQKLEALNFLSDKPVFIPYGLTEEILMKKIKEAYLKFYLNPKTIFRHIKALRDIEAFKKIFMGATILFNLLLSKLKNDKALV